jgi:phosphatidylinositol-3-phosphatase
VTKVKIKLIFLAIVGLVGALTYKSIQNSATNPPPSQAPAATAIATSTAKIPLYDHIFVIIEENKAYDQIIGNPNAPIINELAHTYGLATNYYGIVHPSEGNYVAILGGSTFGIHDDAPFDADVNTPGSHGVNHTISSRSSTLPA